MQKSFVDLFKMADERTHDMCKHYYLNVLENQEKRTDVCLTRGIWRTPSLQVKYKDENFEIKQGIRNHSYTFRKFARKIRLQTQPPTSFIISGISVDVNSNGEMSLSEVEKLKLQIQAAKKKNEILKIFIFCNKYL